MQIQPVNPIYYSYSHHIQKVEPVNYGSQACQPIKPVDTGKVERGKPPLDYSIYHSDIKRVSVYEPLPPKIGDKSVEKEIKPLDMCSEVFSSQKTVSFGYSHKLKILYKKGLLPTVTKGFYGGDLTKATVTLEHLLPHSKKGATTLGNLVLATAENNFKRGNLPLSQFYDAKAAQEYLDQFRGVRVGKFNGDKYIKMIEETVARLLKVN